MRQQSAFFIKLVLSVPRDSTKGCDWNVGDDDQGYCLGKVVEPEQFHLCRNVTPSVKYCNEVSGLNVLLFRERP